MTSEQTGVSSDAVEEPPTAATSTPTINCDVPQRQDTSDVMDSEGTFASGIVRDQGDGAPGGDNITPQTVEPASPVTFKERPKLFSVSVEMDMMQLLLFFIALCTRMWRLEHPNAVVFDELHYMRFTSLYLNRTFFFDSHPPLGKMVFALAGHLSGYTPRKYFDNIGEEYTPEVPVWYLRLFPAMFGSLLIPLAYQVMVELKMSRWTAAIAAVLVLCENSFLTQSRLMMTESMILFLVAFTLVSVLKFRNVSDRPFSLRWWVWLVSIGVSMTFTFSTKYIGVMMALLAVFLVFRDLWYMLADTTLTDRVLYKHAAARVLCLLVLPVIIYITIFYIHLSLLIRAGPSDSTMTSSFQASLEGGLAAITLGQPLYIVYGSQITLRHTFGPACWLHSHQPVYPIKYPDGRGSSHQQQVTCYGFKDVNNWWIIKHPERKSLNVDDAAGTSRIKHGDVVEIVHGMTGRLLNSHDVAAPVSPTNQEVSCYINYNVSMPPQTLWRVEILNANTDGEYWQTIRSRVRLVHVNTSQALKISGMHLPEWGFHQLEVATDKNTNQEVVVWNVEEHKYSRAEANKTAEEVVKSSDFIPMEAPRLSFWEKFTELQTKMFMVKLDGEMEHRFSSSPFDWLVNDKNIGYWISPNSNAQIHLIGNLVSWYTALPGFILFVLVFASLVLARKRSFSFVPEDYLQQMMYVSEVVLGGYLVHYIPFHLVESTYFLYHYLPAVLFKLMFIAVVVEQAYYLVARTRKLHYLAVGLITLWLASVIYMFYHFIGVSYGLRNFTKGELLQLVLRPTWEFIYR